MTWRDGLRRYVPGYRASVRTQVEGEEIDTEFYFDATDEGLLKDAIKHTKYIAKKQLERMKKYVRRTVEVKV